METDRKKIKNYQKSCVFCYYYKTKISKAPCYFCKNYSLFTLNKKDKRQLGK